jgi:hypothetical protein
VGVRPGHDRLVHTPENREPRSSYIAFRLKSHVGPHPCLDLQLPIIHQQRLSLSLGSMLKKARATTSELAMG